MAIASRLCNMKRVYLFFLLLCLAAQSYALRNNFNIRAGGKYSLMSNIDDAARLLLDKNGYPSLDFALGFSHNPSDSSAVFNAWNYPTYGIGFSANLYQTLPSRRNIRLSNFYNLYGFMDWEFVRTRRFSIGLHGEAGVGYTVETYDKDSNRSNYFIGSHFMIMWDLGVYLNWFATPQLEIGVSPQFWHHSNGRVKLPNVGVNEYGVELFVRYHSEPTYRGGKVETQRPEDLHRMRWDVYAGGAPYMSRSVQQYLQKTEGGIPSDASPDWRAVAGGDVMWRISNLYYTGVGMDLFYTSDTEKLEECDKVLFNQTSDKGYHPIQIGISSTHELFLSENLALELGLGLYLYKQIGIGESRNIKGQDNYDQKRTVFFQKLGFRYYFHSFGDIFLELNCRAYKMFRADNLQFCIGKRF